MNENTTNTKPGVKIFLPLFDMVNLKDLYSKNNKNFMEITIVRNLYTCIEYFMLGIFSTPVTWKLRETIRKYTRNFECLKKKNTRKITNTPT
ncbi:hypothetical protein JCM9492_09060 [Aquifex pyrophilus]